MLLTILLCKRTLARLDDYVDAELSPREMKDVRLHLAICHACEEKFAFETRFVQAMREHLQSVLALEEAAAPATRLQEALQVLEAPEVPNEARPLAPGD